MALSFTNRVQWPMLLLKFSFSPAKRAKTDSVTLLRG